MASAYGIFGAEHKEAPNLVMARAVLGVGRAALKMLPEARKTIFE